MTTTVAQMVAAATSTVGALAPPVVEALVYAGEAVVVDIRERDELREHGWIAGAVHVPRGRLEFAADPASAGHRPELDPDVRTIVCCGAGRRGALAAATLRELGYADVAYVEGGVEAWKACGLPVAGLASWHAAPTV